jgi:hypothetical protein
VSGDDAQALYNLMLEVERLTNACEWSAADGPTQRLVEILPEFHWANARRSQAIEGLRGPVPALPFAQRALDTGFCCAKCTDQLARVLYANGDYVRATVASAVSLIITLPIGGPGSSTSRLHTPELQQEALRFLISYVRGSHEHPRIEHPQMKALLALALERSHELSSALTQWSQVPRDTLNNTHFDVDTQHGILSFRLGKQDAAEALLQRSLGQRGDLATAAFEQLVRGHRTGAWAGVARAVETMRSEMTVPDSLTWDFLKSATILCSVASISHSLADDHIAASKAITRIARALMLNAERPRAAAQELLYATQWDETGDMFTPVGLTTARRVVASLNTKRRALTESQLIRSIEGQIAGAERPFGVDY